MQDFAAVMSRREAEGFAFTPAKQEYYESGLVQRMLQAFGRMLGGEPLSGRDQAMVHMFSNTMWLLEHGL